MNYTKLKREIDEEILHDEEQQLNVEYLNELRELGIEVLN